MEPKRRGRPSRNMRRRGRIACPPPLGSPVFAPFPRQEKGHQKVDRKKAPTEPERSQQIQNGANGARTEPERNQNAARTEPERSQNGARTVPEQSQNGANGAKTEPERSQNGARTQPERSQNGARMLLERCQNGARTEPERCQNGANGDPSMSQGDGQRQPQPAPPPHGPLQAENNSIHFAATLSHFLTLRYLRSSKSSIFTRNREHLEN